MLEVAAWLFAPYRETTLVRGDAATLAANYRNTIELVCARIQAYLYGKGERKALDRRYERIGGGPGFAMINPIGADARLAMFADGIRAHVLVREVGPDLWSYSVGCPPFSDFPTVAVLNRLNVVEQCPPEASWGGCDVTGGSPRLPHGSKLPPTEVERVITTLIREHGLAV